jgi:PTH1 family peptidyl-tRNA hydrolase
LIAGLGNPGNEYRDTRHNAGFMVLDRLFEIMPGRIDKTGADTWKSRFKSRNIFFLKPETFMNLSGKAVAPAMRKNNIPPEELLLIYDDVDLPRGRLRIRKNGSSGGHNGVQSVIDETGSSAFSRLRIGIGRSERGDQISHVLSGFSEDEVPLLRTVVEEAAEAVKYALARGIEAAMNEFNSFIPGQEEEKIQKNVK